MMWQPKFDKWQKVWRNWTKPFLFHSRSEVIFYLGVSPEAEMLWVYVEAFRFNGRAEVYPEFIEGPLALFA